MPCQIIQDNISKSQRAEKYAARIATGNFTWISEVLIYKKKAQLGIA